MRDYAFYNAGCDRARGLGKLFLLFRRLLRRILRPLFLRQTQLLEELDGDVAGATGRLDRAERILGNHQVDREAVARRLAALEDRLEALAQQSQGKHAAEEQPPAMRKAS